METFSGKRFHALAASPGLAGEEDTPALRRVLEAYPYFVPAQVLLCLSFRHSGHPAYPLQLQRAAVFTGSRSRLFSLVVEHNHPEVSDSEEQVSTPVQTAEVPASMVEQRKELLNALSGQVKELRKRKKSKPALSTDDSSRLMETILQPFPEEDPLYLENLKNRIHTPREPRTEEKVSRKNHPDWIPMPVVDILAHEVPDIPLAPFHPFHQHTDPEKHSFEDWLAVLSPGHQPDKPPLPPAFSARDTLVGSSGPAFPKSDPVPASSLPADWILITESLAQVYLDQKYYHQALEVFEKLCLKYPEKKIYFATQIEMVKNLINRK